MLRYKDIIEEYENPLNISERETVEYLRRVFEHHLDNTPYWKKMKGEIELNGIFEGDLTEVFEKIFNAGLGIDENYLRNNWVEFIPENYSGRIRFYQSSGTTRERAIGHWSYEYLKLLVKYLRVSFDEIYGLDKKYNEDHRMRAIVHGPYGWYQEEISELVWSYGGLLYFIGVETDGIKQELEEKRLEDVLKGRLAPLARYTKRIFEKDRINTIRTGPQMLALVSEPENIETVILSGLGITVNSLKEIQKTFKNSTIIPLYGYYAFGDIIGMLKNNEVVYYPNYPFTIIFPLVQEEGQYKIARYGERGRMGLIIARPELLIVKIEDESMSRVPPMNPFGWDGFGNPKRGKRVV